MSTTDNNNNTNSNTSSRKEYKELQNRVVKPFEHNPQFCDNTVCNSRYTAFSFIPKNLFEQFRRPLNLYFLLVACLQFISIIAPVSPLSTLLPLLVAFSVTAIKEGFDDIKRHRSDDEYNSRTVRVLDKAMKTWVETTSAKLRVGDIIEIKQDQEIPCDCICIAAPTDEVPMSPSGTIYIRTENLDGEMDLKSRDTAPTGLCSIMSSSSSSSNNNNTPSKIVEACGRFTFNYPPPSPSLSQFDAQIYVGQDAQPLTPNHLLFQSSYLKNVKNIFAVVVYTGNETRTGMNKKPAPQKWAAIDQCVSKYSILIFICQMTLAFSLGLAGYFQNRNATTWYLGDLSERGTSETMKNYGGIIYPLRFFLLTSVMIPISFKFIVDVSKYWMSLVLEWDLSMWDTEREEGMKVKNSSIVEDLAQIEYVLSDKTGTLTQNIMSLHSLSTGAPALYKMEETTSRLSPTASCNFLQNHFNANTAAAAAATASSTTGSPTNQQSSKKKSVSDTGTGKNNNNNTNSSFFKSTSEQQRNSVPSLLNQQSEEDASNLRELLVAMAICNTCTLPKEENGVRDDEEHHLLRHHYQSPSPDEECLCGSAASQGVVLEARDKKSMRIRFTVPSASLSSPSSSSKTTPSSSVGPTPRGAIGGGDRDDATSTRSYIIHHVFEFSSDRKCMSIIVTEEHTGTTWLYSKGADDRILSNLSNNSKTGGDARVSRSCADVNAFAHQGLRTLMFGRRQISKNELDSFEREYDEARTSTENRSEKVTSLQADFEKGLDFLGASGVEDKLQENVQSTVHQIIDGNIKFWMLTGDKVETAKQIAVSCGLFPASVVVPDQNNRDKPNDNLIEISGSEGIAKLRGMDPNKIPLPPGYADAEKAAQLRLYPLGYCSSRVAPTPDGSILPLLKNERPTTLFQTSGGVYEGHNNSNNNNNTDGNNINNNNNNNSEKGMYLVVEGGAVLEQILNDPLLAPRLFMIAKKCVSVVCARVTPGQKAAIAAKVKASGYMTLCIGDGGNDVAMIQEAHVGVGILGREGQQAARAADFSIVNFKDLSTLLFVHGHMSYMRTAYIVLYSFYKSMLISAIQILYNIFFANLSGVSFWNSFVLTMWNGAFTLPQTICFVLDRCIPREVLVRYPILYRLSQSNYGFSPTRFSGYLFMGLFQSAGLMLMVYLTFGSEGSSVVDPSDGQPSSLGTAFTSAYTALLLLQVPLVMMYSSSITGINLFWILVMPCGYAALMAVYSVFKQFDYYRVFFRAENTPHVAFVFLVAAVLFLPPFLWKTFSEMVAPHAGILLRKVWVEGKQGKYSGFSGDEHNQLSDIRTISPSTTRSSGVIQTNNGITDNNNHSKPALSAAARVEHPESTGRFSDV